jgi:hypothetical protein
MPLRIAIAIFLLSNGLLVWQFRSWVRAGSQLAHLKAEAARLSAEQSEAERLEAIEEEKLAANLAAAEDAASQSRLNIAKAAQEQGRLQATIADLSARIASLHQAADAVNGRLSELGGICAARLRLLNAAPAVVSPQDAKGEDLERLREILRAKNLERRFEGLSELAGILSQIQKFEALPVRLSHFYNGWLMELLGEDFPKHEKIRLALERRIGECIEIGVPLIARVDHRKEAGVLRNAVLDEIDESIFEALSCGDAGVKDRISAKIRAAAFDDPLMAGVYQPLQRLFHHE